MDLPTVSLTGAQQSLHKASISAKDTWSVIGHDTQVLGSLHRSLDLKNSFYESYSKLEPL